MVEITDDMPIIGAEGVSVTFSVPLRRRLLSQRTAQPPTLPPDRSVRAGCVAPKQGYSEPHSRLGQGLNRNQDTHEHEPTSLFGTILPHPLHAWVVLDGFTAITWIPALSALYSSICRNNPNPASCEDRDRCRFRFINPRERFSIAIRSFCCHKPGADLVQIIRPLVGNPFMQTRRSGGRCFAGGCCP